MNILEKLQTLRAAFEQASLKFADYMLGELTVRIEGEPVVGTAVTLLDAEGNPLDATGEHVIPELGTIVVSNGVIESITPMVVEAADETAAAAVAVEEVAAVVEQIAPEAPAEVVSDISAEVVGEIMEKLDEMAGELVEMKKKMMAGQEREKSMFALIEALAAEPSVKTDKVMFGQFKKDEVGNLNKVASILKTLKN
jgi:hypothetical protein